MVDPVAQVEQGEHVTGDRVEVAGVEVECGLLRPEPETSGVDPRGRSGDVSRSLLPEP